MLGIRRYRGCSIDLFQGDLATFVCDGLVSAAYCDLSPRFGAIKHLLTLAGNHLENTCQNLGVQEIGSVVVTSAGELPAKHLFHAILPLWNDSPDVAKKSLTQVVNRTLEETAVRNLRHIALAALGTGAAQYPIHHAAEIVFHTIKQFLTAVKVEQNPKRITMVLFDSHTYEIYQKTLFSTFE